MQLTLQVTILMLAASICWPQRTGTYTTETDITYRTADRHDGGDRWTLDLYHPTDRTDYPTVVWFHGGGLNGGDKSIPTELANHGFAVAAANYRLVPDAKVSECIEDAAAATAWVFQEIASRGGDPDRIIIAGYSAGAYLAAMVTLDKSHLAEFGIDANHIAATVCISGQMITHFAARAERGIAQETPIIDDLAPLFHVRPDAPRLVLLTGDADREILGRFEENAYMARMMKITGHHETTIMQLQGLDHGQVLAPALQQLAKEASTLATPKVTRSP